MAKCNCGAQTCGCRLVAGEGVAVTGSGTARDPWIVSAEGGEGGGDGWSPGDLKDTVRTVIDAGWLECTGQAVSRASYAGLFAAIGTTWGEGDGVNTFNLPNFAGIFRMGAGPGYPAGTSGGTRETTLTVANLPPHVHSMSHNHTIYHVHTMAHTHTISHDHYMNHNHTINHDHANATTNSAGNHKHDIARANNDTNGSLVARGSGAGVTTDTGVAGDGAHTHAVNIPSFAGVSGGTAAVTADSNTPNSGGTSVPNTGGSSQDVSGIPSVPNTGSTGAAASFNNLPPHRAVRVLIKT